MKYGEREGYEEEYPDGSTECFMLLLNENKKIIGTFELKK